MVSLILRLLEDQHGVIAIEYALIASLISITAVALMGTIGTSLSTTFSKVAGSL